MSSKSAVKFVAGDESGALFRLVAILTGSKYALKGVGFFLGASLLSWIGYDAALWAMAAAFAVEVAGLLVFLNEDIGRSKKKAPLRSILSNPLRSFAFLRPASSCSARATSGSSLHYPFSSAIGSSGRIRASEDFSPPGSSAMASCSHVRRVCCDGEAACRWTKSVPRVSGRSP